MRQDLFTIPHRCLGLEVFGFGWLLILWGIGSLILLGCLWRRHGWSAETFGYLPILLTLGAVIALLLPRLEQPAALGQPAGLPIRGYGVMLLLGVLAGVTLAARQACRMGLHPDTIYSLAFWVFLSGIVGARAFFVIQYWDQFQRETRVATIGAILNVTEGGLVVYGSFLGGLLAGSVFVYRRKLPALAIADLVTPSLLLGLALGRIGCLLNGCCFGDLCEPPWVGLRFPASSPVYAHQRSLGYLHGFRLSEDTGSQRARVQSVLPGSPAASAGLRPGAALLAINGRAVKSFDQAVQMLAEAQPTLVLSTDQGPVSVLMDVYPSRALPVHPTQIYSAVNAALLCLLAWAYYPFRRRDGEVFAGVLVLYPTTRFLLEIVRTDEAGRFHTGLTISQLISLGLIGLAAAIWIHVLRQPRGSALPPQRHEPLLRARQAVKLPSKDSLQ